MKRELFATGMPWEPIFAYSRAVRIGNQIWISGTTATNAKGEVIGENDPVAQTRQTLKNIEAALTKAGAGLKDVVRTRIYVTNMARDWEAVGRVHGEFFRDVRPATIIIEVSKLIDPKMLVEIDADAFVIES
jgi:enamine deaminase RidA (YjgF/YER057c/UK114 family)